MARTIDLSQAPPPQATCYACGRTVTLNHRARSLGKFRCPFCRADNRVGADGIGLPLSGAAERLEDMPVSRCRRCATENRLPRAILQAGRYTCCECGAVQPVPQTVRKRAGIVSPTSLAVAVLGFLLVLGWSVTRVVTTAAQSGLAWNGQMPSGGYEVNESLMLEQARPLAPDENGARYEARVRVLNQLRQPATFYVKASVLNNGRVVASQTVPVYRLRPGEWRPAVVIVNDPARGPVDSVRVDIAGIS